MVGIRGKRKVVVEEEGEGEGELRGAEGGGVAGEEKRLGLVR